MELSAYFDNTEGTGVLATADSDGNVGVAVYSKPHLLADGTLAFIMLDRLTHHNLQSNSKATYLFMEKGPGYKGKRLFLSKLREEQDSELLYTLRLRQSMGQPDEPKFLVFFELLKTLPLVGTGN